MGILASAHDCRGGIRNLEAMSFQYRDRASGWRLYFGFYAIVSAAIGICVGHAAAADPAITGTLSVPFSFDTSNNAYYWPEFINGSYTLSIPPVLDISINSSALGPTTLDWTNKNNWTTFPLDSSGFSVTNNCCGSYSVKINNNDANLDVLGLSGPTENTAYTKVEILNIHGSGNID